MLGACGAGAAQQQCSSQTTTPHQVTGGTSASNCAPRLQSRRQPERQSEWRPIDDAVVCELVLPCRLSRAHSPPVTAAKQLQRVS
jgi:hypothetical protein